MSLGTYAISSKKMGKSIMITTIEYKLAIEMEKNGRFMLH